MAIAASDILFYQPAVTTEGASYGGSSTTTQIGTTKNALWDDVSGSEAQAGDTEFRKIFIGLGSGAGSDILSNPVVWIITTTPAGDEMEMLLTTAAGDSVNVQSNISGTGVTDWGTPVVKSDGISLANISSSQAIAIWQRRNVPASTPAWADDLGTLRIEGEV